MNISENGIRFIQDMEGLRLKSYKATPQEKYWTVGYGSSGPHVYQGETITAYEADQMLRDDLKPVQSNIDRSVKYHLVQPQYDALCSLIYNIGPAHWWQSEALFYLSRGDIDDFVIQAFDEHEGFTRQAGQILPGLVIRRAKERDLFLHGIYGQSPGTAAV